MSAQKVLNELLADDQRGTFILPQKLTVATYLRDWLNGIKTAGRRPTTIGSYRWLCEKHIIPRIGAVQLQQLDPATLDHMYADLLTSGRDKPKRNGPRGLSPRTVRYIHTVLGKALSDAERKGIVRRNVARLADPPYASSARSPEMKVWTPTETARFLEFAKAQKATSDMRRSFGSPR